MKKFYISSIVIFAVILIYIMVPIPVTNSKIQQENKAIHVFIVYEQQFLALDQKNLSLHQHVINKQEDDRYQVQDISRTVLLLNFERAAHELNETVNKLQNKYPFLSNTVKPFMAWKSHVEKQLLLGKHLLYWQGPLLSYQLRMMSLINHPDSTKNWLIEQQMPQEKHVVSTLSIAEKCKILNQFGKTQSPKILSEQLAILTSHPPECR